MSKSKLAPMASFSPGYVANAKEGTLSTCRFGGCSWSVTGSRQDLGEPVLLVTMDFAHPLLSKSVSSEFNGEIPLFSYIDLDGLIPLQEYSLDHKARHVAFEPIPARVKGLPVEHRLATPIPEGFLRLRNMRDSEKAFDNASYWGAMDTFLGGEGAIRLCGAPLYIDDVETKQDGFRYIASIGYESPDHGSGLLPNGAFFLGEVAHYFFISKDWQTVRVVTQAA